ncbi:MAG: O-antigen ligase family protein [Candidatus Eremiobacteraeota bacterium]|nr:O-antigen ligase family protein [Candidatus Eremiobacteraeota bacterium]
MLSSARRASAFATAGRVRATLGSPGVLISAMLVVLCVLAAFGAVALAGTKTGMALALLVAVGPVAIYVALTAPLIFPFGLFAIMVPFDNLMTIHSFGTITKLLAICCAVALAARLFVTRRYVVPDKAVLAWLPLVLLAIASLAWAIDPMNGVTNVLSLLELFLLYSLLSFMPVDRKTLGFVIVAVIAGGILAGSYGAYLFHRGVDVTQDARLVVQSGEQSIDPNHFAAALLLPLALTLIAFVESRRILTRAFSLGALGLIGVGLLLAGSRGALVAAAVMVVYMTIRSRKRMALLFLTIGGGGIGLAAFGQHILGRMNQIGETGGAGRFGIWRVAAVAFSRHPFLGSGAGNFSNAYNDAFLSVPAFASMRIVEGAQWSTAPHSNIIWVAVELGAVGLGILLYAWWMQYRSLRSIGETSQLYPLRIAIEAALIGQFVAGLFLGTLNYKYLWLTFMIAMIVRNAELDTKGGSLREGVVSPLLQTAARRS